MAKVIPDSINRVSKVEASVSNHPGSLYVVATPIGNLEDITHRAARVLSQVDLIAAEDTRHSRKLLHRLGVSTKMTAFHDHNEKSKITQLLTLVGKGKSIALISDAGTPLVCDPGFGLVRAAHEAGIRVVPVPGPCAAVAALSTAGLPSDRFVFEGFPPARPPARATFFEQHTNETRTLIFYETPHRITASLEAMATAFGRERQATLARELTKKFENVIYATLGDLCDWTRNQGEGQLKGEFVVLIHGARPSADQFIDPEAERILRILLRELPVKQAAALAAEITGERKHKLYQCALQVKGS